MKKSTQTLFALLFAVALSCPLSSIIADESSDQDREIKIVTFNIMKDAEMADWNTKETMIMLKVGDVLKLVNNDTVVHAMHTNGSPCSHTPDIEPGESYNAKMTSTYNPMKMGPLYDHYHSGSKFWLMVE